MSRSMMRRPGLHVPPANNQNQTIRVCDEMSEERLQKIIARAGLASRRKAEEWITQGRVCVDGRIIRELGTRVDPRRSEVVVNGKALGIPRQFLYFMLNKPRGCVTTV